METWSITPTYNMTSNTEMPPLDTRTRFFQPPPISPQNSSSTSADYFSPRSRKRQRPDSSHNDSVQQTPWTATPSWVQCPTPSDTMLMSSAGVNDKYCLAGGFDTPGLWALSDNGRQEHEWCRRDIRDKGSAAGDGEAVQDSGRRNVSQLYGPLARERNGVARMQSSPNGDPRGWASYAFQLVGQVFAFGSGMIRGFYSGGGKGYDFDQSSLSDSWAHSRPPLQRRRRRGSTPVPGQWQDDDFLGDFEQDNTDSPTSLTARPLNKRRQTDKDSWVLVGTPEVNVEISPKRKSSATTRPSLGVRAAGASRANSRRSLLPVSRRQSYITQTSSPAHASSTTHPDPQTIHNKRASFAPTRPTNGSRPSSASGLANAQNDTYISPETARLLKRQAKQEKATDKAMSSMSKRLEDLIRQGQEALGTKVAVEGEDAEDMDEGFVDEAW